MVQAKGLQFVVSFDAVDIKLVSRTHDEREFSSSKYNFIDYRLYCRYLKYSLGLSKIDRSYFFNAFYQVANSNAAGANVVWNFCQLNFDRISNL